MFVCGAKGEAMRVPSFGSAEPERRGARVAHKNAPGRGRIFPLHCVRDVAPLWVGASTHAVRPAIKAGLTAAQPDPEGHAQNLTTNATNC